MLLTLAADKMEFDNVHLRFLLALRRKAVIRNSSTQFTSSHGRELFEMKQTSICHEYGLETEANRGLLRHSFWRNYIE